MWLHCLNDLKGAAATSEKVCTMSNFINLSRSSVPVHHIKQEKRVVKLKGEEEEEEEEALELEQLEDEDYEEADGADRADREVQMEGLEELHELLQLSGRTKQREWLQCTYCKLVYFFTTYYSLSLLYVSYVRTC